MRKYLSMIKRPPPQPFVKVVFKIFGDLNLYFQFEFDFRNTVL
jgi:hypothetical protein